MPKMSSLFNKNPNFSIENLQLPGSICVKILSRGMPFKQGKQIVDHRHIIRQFCHFYFFRSPDFGWQIEDRQAEISSKRKINGCVSSGFWGHGKYQCDVLSARAATTSSTSNIAMTSIIGGSHKQNLPDRRSIGIPRFNVIACDLRRIHPPSDLKYECGQ